MLLISSGIQDVNSRQSDSDVYRNTDVDTDDGIAFIRGGGQTAVAAKNSHLQILNPAASGVTCLLDRIMFGLATGGQANLRIHSTALSTLQGGGSNKSVGGAAGQVDVYADSNAGLLGTAIGAFYVGSNDFIDIKLTRPFQLGEGEGLVIAASTVNVTMLGTFEWRELTI